MINGSSYIDSQLSSLTFLGPTGCERCRKIVSTKALIRSVPSVQKLRERMNGHRADIKNKNNTPVGLHFNAKGHEPRISGLQKTAQDTTARRVREKKWIKLLESCKTYKCMNRDSGIDFLIL